MRKIILAVTALVATGYFLANASGLLGRAMTVDEVSAALNARAKEINDSDGIKYDKYSLLTAAEVDGLTITVAGKFLFQGVNVSSTYLGSRKNLTANKLCNDDVSKAMLAGGATFVYNWVAGDGAEIGTVTAGPEFCDAS